ncbi:probable UDP-N-acetylglucosamine--peptide N-acetylglucosaminyltransferase SEC [Cucurbita moschata]|uniref:Probable UDP-N-acetylglucosamine--peptide N-acetylglucosaminyltransferase SPINDLY n=1 Tax=Cucurbita moschata TaxID=3662 RepID=A0A6J1EVA5_CUCMO|nr:probable UDP-N-acetylglucosamine--peptide N-acetylglucosaminyltransferase SEC [Cucurbita moschata]XP_022929790.1 probable UDP-N-acetylglucosamine--peptide N-acetylglucosaminyltransferase SEC [Cucurbita moschata]
MISVQGEVRHQQLLAGTGTGTGTGTGVSRAGFVSDRGGESFAVKAEPPSLSLVKFESADSLEVDEETYLALAHKKYKNGDYKQALEHSTVVYERNSLRTDNLLLMGAIYYQLGDFDMCIAKNEEALRIEPRFAECYGNMANAWKEKGNIDLAIRYYLLAIELRPNFCDAWSNLASAYMRKGRLGEAAQCCRQALALNPLLVDAHSNLGNLMKTQGLVQEAYSCYLEALRIQPTFAIAWSNLAGLFMESGDLNRALQYYKEAVKLKPQFPDAYLNLGNVYKALGMPQEAILCYQRAIQMRPNYAIAYGNLASTYYEQSQLDLAILHYKQAITCDPRFLEAYNNLGNALKEFGRVDEAIQCYNQCLSLQPSHPQALTNLGNIYMEWNMVPAAASYYKATLRVTTGLSAPFNNLAIIYKQQGNYADAISCYNEVLRIDPLAADGLVNRGNTYKEIGRVSEAIQDYIRAINIRPTMAEAHANLASAYKDSGHVEAAIKSYKQALLLRPEFPEATCNLLHTLRCVCNWEDRDKMFAEVEGIIKRQINMSVLPSVQPFHAIAYPIDPLLALEISRSYASHCLKIASRFSLPSFNHPSPVPIKKNGGFERLRVGYVSSDFGNHPLSHLMGSVFGMHNREHVEVFCYALSPNDNTEWRQRIQFEAEHFVDVSAMTSDVIAKMINEDKIQILINLNGYTKGARNEIFAMQPAPIQVSYMGFPGTTGATYIDYLVSDEFVSPLRYAHIYSEKIVHLPHCYFVNDYKQKNLDVLAPNCQHKRSDYGLPDGKFIFACFNQLYKMDPEIFNTWCNILKRVPNSALWLLRFPAAGEMRLRAYAAAQGVQPEQIIFTDVAMKNEHISRSALADLFLDTPLCNAHTTGTDILWAGLPMITLPLEKMATRVAGSLCLATGLGDEMIVSSMKEYEEKAVSLALNRPKLQALTNKLKAVRMTCPLFDTARWVRNLERSYFKMWNLHCSGQRPQHFKVTENNLEYPFDR